MNIYKVFDISILVLISIFLGGFIITDYQTFGFEEPLVQNSDQWKLFFEYFVWMIIGLLILDLGLKYKKTNDPKKFVKKYWIDIAMLALVPAFAAFKIFKLGIGLVKKLKTAKMGIKIIHKTKKVTKTK